MPKSPTIYRRKYGPPPSPIQIIIGAHRSGLTPITAYNLTHPPANASREERIAYQQSRLHGYTRQILVDLDVVSLKALEIPIHCNPIDPALQRSRWLDYREDDFKIPMSRVEEEGIAWTAKNPIVWKYLEPCLRLASRLFGRMHTDSFVLLLLGTPKTIPIEEFKPQDVFKYGGGTQRLFKRFNLLPYHSLNAWRTRRELDRIEKYVLSRHFRLAFGVDVPDGDAVDESSVLSAAESQKSVGDHDGNSADESSVKPAADSPSNAENQK
ncbi:hypothetical protein sscle_15g106770 [Sclerotinia sclerotiorum 1980 UF-70]|uniref:Uncharacterized protein n=1 Tax=Sclerotinia sclerotiorum (strain ATCC 18683 / 1980 / Ss-1) TaxID=665079 RepID=A0A1D9QLT9_SCLS1|nr:hypothetical protein sscle_15g106770 [Sclerotinia sclerotiorum 1980 UF-70]